MNIHGVMSVSLILFSACYLSVPHLGEIRPKSILTAPLKVHPENGRYFVNASGDAVFLTGSHTWMNLQDFKKSGYSDFDWENYLDFLKEKNHNFIRFWLIEYEYDKDNDVLATPCPYSRPSGGDLAYDGRPKYDIGKFNSVFFDRLHARVKSAGDRGIYVSVMLFSSFASGYQGTEWDLAWKSHPYNGNNNVNGINADTNNDGRGSELHTLSSAEVTAYQENYVKRVVDAVNDLDNVLFEIGNEMVFESKDFQYHMIRLIHDYEKGKPKQHPVGMTTGGPLQGSGWQNMSPGDLLESPAEWISPSETFGDVKDNPPETDGTKVVILDTDHIPRPEHGVWVWKSFLRGYHPIQMDVIQVPYPYAIGEDWNDPDNPLPRRIEIRRESGNALDYALRMDLAKMTPRSSLSGTGYCLANIGSEYLIFQPDTGSFTLDLSNAPWNFNVEWFRPETREKKYETLLGGSPVTLTPPWSGQVALYLKKQ